MSALLYDFCWALVGTKMTNTSIRHTNLDPALVRGILIVLMLFVKT